MINQKNIIKLKVKLEEGTNTTRPDPSKSEATKGTNTTPPDPKIIKPPKKNR